MTHRNKIAVCVFILGSVAGCGASQAQGSYPSDMTPDRHCAAAAREHSRASQDHRAAEQAAVAGKTTVENRVRAEHNASARKHERYASQHEDAALFAAGGYAPPCGPLATTTY